MVFLDQLLSSLRKKAAATRIDLLCEDALADSERLTDDCGRTTLIVERTNRNGLGSHVDATECWCGCLSFCVLGWFCGCLLSFLQAPSAAIIRRLTKRLRANFMDPPWVLSLNF